MKKILFMGKLRYRGRGSTTSETQDIRESSLTQGPKLSLLSLSLSLVCWHCQTFNFLEANYPKFLGSGLISTFSGLKSPTLVTLIYQWWLSQDNGFPRSTVFCLSSAFFFLPHFMRKERKSVRENSVPVDVRSKEGQSGYFYE
jgi:hypothetical protein